MSLSKNIRKYNRCVCLMTRQINSESANPEKLHDGFVKTVARPRLKTMSVSHWKLLSHLKDYINKASNERGVLFVLSKEWFSLLQKLQLQLPSFYGVIERTGHRSINAISSDGDGAPKEQPNTTVSTVAAPSPPVPSSIMANDTSLPVPKETPQEVPMKEGYTFPQVFSELKKRINTKQNGDDQSDFISKWKPSKKVVLKPSISSRTKHVVSSLATAESLQSRLKRVEDLIEHLNQYPESKHYAVKEGAVTLLLRLREDIKDKVTVGVIRQALAMLGYIDPLPGRGIRILSIDGGGVRGVVVIEILRKLEALTGKRVHEMFDFICGVSTGAILVGVMGAQKKSLLDALNLYKDMSKKIFNQSAFWGTSNLVWSHSYYSTEVWEELLKEFVGEIEMIQTTRDETTPKLAAVSAVVNQPKVMAFVFRNYALPYKTHSHHIGSSKYRMWEAARASAAAPAYFEEFRLDEYLHQDGGILVNNPCALAIHEALHLWPGSSLQCVVSIGTGRTSPNSTSDLEPGSGASSLKTKFMRILDSATDTEGVHMILNDLLPKNVYYRFNPYLTEMVVMDEARDEKLHQLELDCDMYYRRNEEKFQMAAEAILARQTFTQKFQNWVNLKRTVWGLNSKL